MASEDDNGKYLARCGEMEDGTDQKWREVGASCEGEGWNKGGAVHDWAKCMCRRSARGHFVGTDL